MADYNSTQYDKTINILRGNNIQPTDDMFIDATMDYDGKAGEIVKIVYESGVKKFQKCTASDEPAGILFTDFDETNGGWAVKLEGDLEVLVSCATGAITGDLDYRQIGVAATAGLADDLASQAYSIGHLVGTEVEYDVNDESSTRYFIKVALHKEKQ